MAWSGKEYTVTFDKQSGSGGSVSIVAIYDEVMPTATAPTRTNYSFGGYYDEVDGGGTQYYSSTMTSEHDWNKSSNTTPYAYWTGVTSTVSLDRQGGFSGSTQVTASYGSPMPVAYTPSKTGYTFNGYYTSTNGGGTQYYTSTMASSRAWDQSSDDILYAKWREYEVGDIGPAGGFIFYDKGYSSSGWRYLSAAPRGWYGGTTDPTAPWGGYGVTTGATSQSYGAGLENTNLIVATLGSGTYAAKLCADYSNTVNGVTYSDWFLPGGDALFTLAYYYHHSYYANMDSVYYWSSTETDSTHSYIMSASGSSTSLFAAERVQAQIRSVRPIRRF